MEQWASQTFQDKSPDLWVIMHSDHSEKYSVVMEKFYSASAVTFLTFELRFLFHLTSNLSSEAKLRVLIIW